MHARGGALRCSPAPERHLTAAVAGR